MDRGQAQGKAGDRHTGLGRQPVGAGEPVGDLVLCDRDRDPVRGHQQRGEDNDADQQLSHSGATLPTGRRRGPVSPRHAGARGQPPAKGGSTSMTAPSASGTASAARPPAALPPRPAPRPAWRRRVSPRPPRQHASPLPSSAQLPLARRLSSLTSAPGDAALGPFGRSLVEGGPPHTVRRGGGSRMSELYLLTNAPEPPSEIMPALGLLLHTVRTGPADMIAFEDAAAADAILV